MPDPISLAAGYFLLKTAVSMGITLSEDVGANKIGFELMKAAAGNFYSDILKFGGQKAWSGISSRMRSEYNSEKPLNHDLQKAIRKSQIEATISACESCADDLKLQDSTFIEKLKNKWSLNDDEKWLKNVVQALTINLAEIKDKNYVPPTITDDIDVLKIADSRNYPLTDESVQNLVNSIKEQTILEIRLANPPDFSQKQIASQLENKIYNGWTKKFQGETIQIDWYKLLCDRFSEEYKENARVTNALQKAFFQDIKSDTSKKFADFSENHFEKLGGQIISKLESIEGNQDRLYNFVEIFKDENDRKLTEALVVLKSSVSEINTFTEKKAKETQDIFSKKIDESIKIQNKEIFEYLNKYLDNRFNEIEELIKNNEIEIAKKFKETIVTEFQKQTSDPIKVEEKSIKFNEAQTKQDEFIDLQQTETSKLNFINKENPLMKAEIEDNFVRIQEILTLLDERKKQPFSAKRFSKDKLTPVEQFVFSLKKRYQIRYLNKLDNRFEISLEFSELFTISEKYSKNASEGRDIDIISNLFEQTGRLLITGNPGAGKTVLLLKLAIYLLDKTDIYQEEPFPVIFNLASWSEKYEYFDDWLIDFLKNTEGLSDSFAKTLLRQKKIIFLLDGLDELARNEDVAVSSRIRAKCLSSLNDYLTHRNKVVICSRTDEFIQMHIIKGQDNPVNSVIKMSDLTTTQIQKALLKASKTQIDRVAAINILEILKRDQSGVFLEILRNPFYFTISLEVFDQLILKENNFPKETQELKEYLIREFVETKLRHMFNPKRFKHEEIYKWLKGLAQLMNEKAIVTFGLEHLQTGDLRLINRLFLYIKGKAPLRYETFLNYTVEARILEKDGGFWRFRHQELQDYFAKLP